MEARLRSALTLTTLTLLLVVAVVVGWSAVTKPLPELAETPLCVDTEVAAGEKVFPDQVAVSVFNAGQRNGLASKTMNLLVERGFVAADTGNAPEGTEVTHVQVWADDPQDPAVALVLAQFRKAEVVQGQALGLGVVVVVGDGFKKLGKKVESVDAAAAATICSPPDGVA